MYIFFKEKNQVRNRNRRREQCDGTYFDGGYMEHLSTQNPDQSTIQNPLERLSITQSITQNFDGGYMEHLSTQNPDQSTIQNPYLLTR